MEEKILHWIQTSIVRQPRNWINVYQIYKNYTRNHMQDARAVGSMVDNLAGIFQIQLSAAERENIIQWLIERQIDPQSVRQFCSAFLKAYLSQKKE